MKNLMTLIISCLFASTFLLAPVSAVGIEKALLEAPNYKSCDDIKEGDKLYKCLQYGHV